MFWKEWWHGRKDEDLTVKKTKSLFPKESTHLPPKGSNVVRHFLTGIKSETMGTKFNKSNPNISEEETKALAKLIELQKTCQIIIKPCDEGAGISVDSKNLHTSHMASFTHTATPTQFIFFNNL